MTQAEAEEILEEKDLMTGKPQELVREVITGNVLGVNLQQDPSPKKVAIAALRLCEPHEKLEVLEMIVNKVI